VVTGHIIAAALKVLKMTSTNEVPSEIVIPNPQNVWMQKSEERKAILKDISQQIIDKFVDFSFSTEDITDKVC